MATLEELQKLIAADGSINIAAIGDSMKAAVADAVSKTAEAEKALAATTQAVAEEGAKLAALRAEHEAAMTQMANELATGKADKLQTLTGLDLDIKAAGKHYADAVAEGQAALHDLLTSRQKGVEEADKALSLVTTKLTEVQAALDGIKAKFF